MPPLPDYYRALGVARGASAEDIRRAFQALAKELHPDVAASPSEGSARRFQAVMEAYDTLRGDATRRA